MLLKWKNTYGNTMEVPQRNLPNGHLYPGILQVQTTGFMHYLQADTYILLTLNVSRWSSVAWKKIVEKRLTYQS